MHKHLINPAPDFTERLMLKVAKINQQKKLVYDVLVAFLLFSPFLARQIWLWLAASHDYFSAGRLPFSQTVLTTYGFFLSTIAAYILLSFGLAAILIYRLGWRRLALAVKSISQAFNQARFRT